VCDRQANRLQAFDKMGNFKKSIDLPWKNYTAEDEDLRRYCHTLWRTFPPCTLVQKISRGTSAVSVEFSRDPNQRLIYVVNQNQRDVDILDRATGKVVSTIGDGTGLFFQGQLFDAIRAAVDSKGNVYVAILRQLGIDNNTILKDLGFQSLSATGLTYMTLPSALSFRLVLDPASRDRHFYSGT
jgi:hypothetical protein